jgi:enoyl-CoA hydratase/carnithine racemase
MTFSWQSLCLTAFGIFSTARALELPEYAGLKTSLNNSILEVTLHNPKSLRNLWSQDTQDDLTDLVARLQKDNETNVIIFKSDVPRFFMGHLDLTIPNLGT